MTNKLNDIKTNLEKFRGVVVDEVSSKDKTLFIEFSCECRESLMAVISSEDICPIFFTVHSYENICYTGILENDDQDYSDDLNESLLFNLEHLPDLDEKLEEINNYDLLDEDGRNKYLKYVKYLRSRYINGFSELTAMELLNTQRFCCDCGEALYSKQDEVQIVLEFNDPEEIYERLSEIECSD